METSLSVLGAEHASKLTSMAKLAYMLRDQHQEDKAIELIASCLERRRKVLGSSHPATGNPRKALKRGEIRRMIRTATMGMVLTVFLGPGLTDVLEVMHRKMGMERNRSTTL